MDEVKYIKDNFNKLKHIFGFNLNDIKYIRSTKNGRKICTLIFSDCKITTQVARIIIQCELGRLLTNLETVDHIDGDRTNNNIENLQILSLSDNICKGSLISKKDIALKGLVTKTVNNTILKGEKVAQSILTYLQVLDIRKMYLTGNYSYNDLAKKFNVNRSNICQIINRKTWKHI